MEFMDPRLRGDDEFKKFAPSVQVSSRLSLPIPPRDMVAGTSPGKDAIRRGKPAHVEVRTNPDRGAPCRVQAGNRHAVLPQHEAGRFLHPEAANGDRGAGEEGAFQPEI